MRAALYARYSTDLQSTASLADQYRLCEDRAAALNIEVVARHGDQALFMLAAHLALSDAEMDRVIARMREIGASFDFEDAPR